MISERQKKIEPGDTLYWALGKQYLKGKFVKYTGNVLDYKVLLVQDDNGNEDEILDVFLINEETFIRETEKTFKSSFVKNKIEKKEELNDEIEDTENLTNSNKSENENINPEKILKDIEEVELNENKIIDPNLISNKIIKKVNKNTVSGDELKPTLKNLDMLLRKEGCSIDRDNIKWVKYHLILSDGQHKEIIYKGKVWELYNIYVESGLQGLLNLT